RLYGVLNKRLADRAFVAGDYSIADMAIYPWIVPHERQGQNIADSRTSSAGSRRCARGRRSSAPTRRRRRSTRTWAASAPRRSARSFSARPRHRSIAPPRKRDRAPTGAAELNTGCVMRGQKRVEDARKRAYDPRIHRLRIFLNNDGLPRL